MLQMVRLFFFFQAEDGIRDLTVTGVQTCALPISQASYPEGPMWDQGRLLYVEYAAGDIKTWDGKQSRIYWRREHCGPNALIHFRHDHILVACYDGNYLVELDAQGKERSEERRVGKE